eukprot:jgi/Chrpa1/14496/Chrysochromulina_OHIO_Genome00002697-RA
MVRVLASFSPPDHLPIFAASAGGELAVACGRLVYIVQSGPDVRHSSWRLPAAALLVRWLEDSSDAVRLLIVCSDGSAWTLRAPDGSIASPPKRPRAISSGRRRFTRAVGDEHRFPMPAVGPLVAAHGVAEGLLLWPATERIVHVRLHSPATGGAATDPAMPPELEDWPLLDGIVDELPPRMLTVHRAAEAHSAPRPSVSTALNPRLYRALLGTGGLAVACALVLARADARGTLHCAPLAELRASALDASALGASSISSSDGPMLTPIAALGEPTVALLSVPEAPEAPETAPGAPMASVASVTAGAACLVAVGALGALLVLSSDEAGQLHRQLWRLPTSAVLGACVLGARLVVLSPGGAYVLALPSLPEGARFVAEADAEADGMTAAAPSSSSAAAASAAAAAAEAVLYGVTSAVASAPELHAEPLAIAPAPIGAIALSRALSGEAPSRALPGEALSRALPGEALSRAPLSGSAACARATMGSHVANDPNKATVAIDRFVMLDAHGTLSAMLLDAHGTLGALGEGRLSTASPLPPPLPPLPRAPASAAPSAAPSAAGATATAAAAAVADAADAFTGSHTERCVRERLQRVGDNSAQLGALQALSRAAEARLASAVAAHAALVAMAKLGGQEACKLRLSDEGTSVCVDVKNPSAHALSRAWSLVALVSSEVPLGDTGAAVDETEATRLHARDSAAVDETEATRLHARDSAAVDETEATRLHARDSAVAAERAAAATLEATDDDDDDGAVPSARPAGGVSEVRSARRSCTALTASLAGLPASGRWALSWPLPPMTWHRPVQVRVFLCYHAHEDAESATRGAHDGATRGAHDGATSCAAGADVPRDTSTVTMLFGMHELFPHQRLRRRALWPPCVEGTPAPLELHQRLRRALGPAHYGAARALGPAHYGAARALGPAHYGAAPTAGAAPGAQYGAAPTAVPPHRPPEGSHCKLLLRAQPLQAAAPAGGGVAGGAGGGRALTAEGYLRVLLEGSAAMRSSAVLGAAGFVIPLAPRATDGGAGAGASATQRQAIASDGL